jgi:hypothetical protein
VKLFKILAATYLIVFGSYVVKRELQFQDEQAKDLHAYRAIMLQIGLTQMQPLPQSSEQRPGNDL